MAIGYRTRVAAGISGIAITLLCAPPVNGQPDEPRHTAARTAWGDPDIQGIWTNTSSTPFERPEEFGERARLTDEEFAEAQANAIQAATEVQSASFDNAGSTAGPDHWYEHHGKTSNRTSFVVVPLNGRVPPLTDEAQTRRVIGTVNRERFEMSFDTWEDLSAWDRCITRGVPGSMFPTFYNNNYQILQIPGYVVILYEMIHDARIIPLDGRPALPGSVRQWMGDSRGRWDGDTLVVEVANFTNQTQVHPVRGTASQVNHSEQLRVIERFTPVDAATMEYEVTVEDPSTFTESWMAAIPMTKNGAPTEILEYACQEGQQAVRNILSGARAQERKAAQSGR